MSANYLHGDLHFIDHTPYAAVLAGAILQVGGQVAIAHSDLEAGVPNVGAVSVPVGQTVYEVPKAADIVILDGCDVWWNPTAGTATYAKLAAIAFRLGTAVGDTTAAGTTVRVRVNHQQRFDLDLMRDPCDTVLVANGSVLRQGGAVALKFSTATEAQKADAITKDGIAGGEGFILEGSVEIVTNSDNAAGDFNVGLASGTHATDADAIVASLFIHTDGAALDILAESDDATTEVNATDTEVDAVAGTRFHFCWDARNLSDIQLYINGVNKLPSSVFKLNAAAGPLYLLAHAEKTSDDSPGEFHVDQLRLRRASRIAA